MRFSFVERSLSTHPHHLPRHQRMDPVRRPEPPDLGHHGLALARLDVGDVHVDAAVELRQLVARRGRVRISAHRGRHFRLIADDISV
ncbi:MAG: hypothetical protein ACSLEZ_11645 [Thiobacillus sp.]